MQTYKVSPEILLAYDRNQNPEFVPRFVDGQPEAGQRALIFVNLTGVQGCAYYRLVTLEKGHDDLHWRVDRI